MSVNAVNTTIGLIVTMGADCVFQLLSMLQKYCPDLPIILVANGCSDEQVDRLKRAVSPITRVEHLPENRGGSGGFAFGMNCFLKDYPAVDNLWLLDDDAVVNAMTLPQLLQCADQLDADHVPWGACGSAIETAENPGFLTECGAFIKRFSGRFSSAYANFPVRDLPKTPFEVEYSPATSLLISRRALAKTGTFNPNIFIHFDDIDWCFRCRKKGFRIFAAPGSIISHPSRISKPATTVRYYDAANVIWFYRRHLPALTPFALAAPFFRMCYFYAHGFHKTAQLYRQGILDGIKGEQRLKPDALEWEQYKQPDTPNLSNPVCILFSERHLKKCMQLNIAPPSRMILMPRSKIRRLVKNFLIYAQMWYKRYNTVIVDDDFKSFFTVPFFGKRTIYWDFERNSIKEK